MKRMIMTILQQGFSTAKNKKGHNLDDLIHYFPPLKHLVEKCDVMNIRCNKNPFWSKSNNENRNALYYDFFRVLQASSKDPTWVSILDRIENGDKYGIKIDK
jgi:hypothetical protein